MAPRVVAAVDMDAFYCQVTEQNRPELQGKPVGIRQKYLIVTCNYAARARGVGKLMATEEALRRCPDLVVVDGSDLAPFRAASAAIAAVIEGFGAPVQRLGMDESFLDLTQAVQRRLEAGAEPTEFAGHVQGDPAAESAPGLAALAVGSQIVRDIRAALREQLGFACCGGVSDSKLGAKLAAEIHKPDQQCTLLPGALPDFCSDVSLRKIQGIGRKVVRALFNEYVERFPETQTVATASDLCCKHVRRLPRDALERATGSPALALALHDRVRGVDKSPVVASGAPKTISQEETSLPHPDAWEPAAARLRELCERVLPLARARHAQTRQWPCTMRLSVSDKGGKIKVARRDRAHRSRQDRVGPEAFATIESLYRSAEPLLRAAVGAKPFLLCRMNLAITDFAGTGASEPSADITQFFKSHGTTPQEPTRPKRPATPTLLSKATEADADELLRGIDRSVFDALPPDLQHELLDQKRAEAAAAKRRRGTLDAFFPAALSRP